MEKLYSQAAALNVFVFHGQAKRDTDIVERTFAVALTDSVHENHFSKKNRKIHKWMQEVPSTNNIFYFLFTLRFTFLIKYFPLKKQF